MKLFNNLNDINYKLEVEDFQIKEVEQELPPLVLQSIWEKSSDRNVWTPITEPFNHYILEDNFVVPLKKDNYITYTVDDTANFSIRYSLQPIYQLTDEVVVYNKFARMSHLSNV